MTDVALPLADYFCRQCQARKPATSFEFIIGTNRNGEPFPCARKICNMCAGKEGHKVCRTCKGDKDIAEFYWVKSGNSDVRRPMADCKDCYREAKNLRQRGHKKPLRGARGPKPGASYNGRKTPGWTPPPTAAQLAAIHRNYSPPAGWVRPRGEECA